MKDRRRFSRWSVCIPCNILWKDYVIDGQITNLSYGGALIEQLKTVPPKGVLVVVTFKYRIETVKLKCKIESRVVRPVWERLEEGRLSFIAVEFVESPEEIRAKLDPLVRDHAV
ncbi:PilZ domain-containing protein [Acidobacteria bacterium AH-259-D05]|nr:PilZ domain-containing protein [Acidobacteria bacterium AH-259-D05]